MEYPVPLPWRLFIAVGVTLVGVVPVASCSDPTGPKTLEQGTFRADLSGAIQISITGDADVSEVTSFPGSEFPEASTLLDLRHTSTNRRVAISFLTGTPEPQVGNYAIKLPRPPITSDSAVAGVDIDREGDSIFFVARSGSIEISKVTSREVLGLFSLSLKAEEGNETLQMEGEFRATR